MNAQPLIDRPLVDAVVRTTARQRHLPYQDVDDLRSELWVKLLDREARVVRRFTGRGSLFGYLLRVANRLVLDDRNARLGRWRPSARAMRTGLGATRCFVPLEECPPSRLAAADRPAAVDGLLAREARQKIRIELVAAMRGLTVEERRLLRLRFTEGLRVSEIARLDRRRPMACYREYSRLLALLRARLAAAGVDAGLVAVALESRHNW